MPTIYPFRVITAREIMYMLVGERKNTITVRFYATCHSLIWFIFTKMFNSVQPWACTVTCSLSKVELHATYSKLYIYRG
jgi:hypothetical protein